MELKERIVIKVNNSSLLLSTLNKNRPFKKKRRKRIRKQNL